MTIRVTRDQVDNAKVLMALDRADGRESDEWIVRLAGARAEIAATPAVVPGATTIAQLEARVQFLEAEVARLRRQKPRLSLSIRRRQSAP